MLYIKGKKVSEETAALALEEYFKNHPKEAKFEPVKVCCLTVSVEPETMTAGDIVIRTQHSGAEVEGHNKPPISDRVVDRFHEHEVPELIKALQDARNFCEAHKQC